MDDSTDRLGPAQREAQHILQHLLTKLQDPQSKYFTRYARWIQRHPHLLPFCIDCVRPEVWQALDRGLTYHTMKSIYGDFAWKARGIYFDAVLSAPEEPSPQTRLYIGQSTNLRLRISQHQKFRYRRDNPSLHYHALHASADNAYGILVVIPSPGMGNGALPGMDNEGLLLNLLEMWMCLLFRSLPEQTLDIWLPDDVGKRGDFGGLNVLAPLENGDGSRREIVDLGEATDPLVREWGELKRREWREKVKRELDLVEREEEGEKAAKAELEAVLPWLYALGGFVGGAVVTWAWLERARSR